MSNWSYYSIDESRRQEIIDRIKHYTSPKLENASEVFVDLGGIKTVRILLCDNDAIQLISRELTWVITNPTDTPDATIILWKELDISKFHSDVLGLALPELKKDDVFHIFTVENGVGRPFVEVNMGKSSAHVADKNVYYCSCESFRPEDWINDGHLFVQIFYNILCTSTSSLVHGACIGINGNGILMCARGQRGKSTLAVTAMLHGFEYVSDDYLILEKGPDGLLASPIYSIITLSPRMYNVLYEDLSNARFVGISHLKGKYVLDMAKYGRSVRKRYPVRLCLFPEIDLNATAPLIERCTMGERGRAITQMAHSTVLQMYNQALKQNQRDSGTVLKIIDMLQGKDFYKMTLTNNIFANAEYLKDFMNNYQ